MNILLIGGVIFAWMLISAIVVVCASMMSSQISKVEEGEARPEKSVIHTRRVAVRESKRIPTQPRPEVAR